MGLNRLVAAFVGFAGVMILLRPWESGFTVATLLPIAAAVRWGGASLITNRLARDEPQTSIAMWLLVLLTPVNLLFSLQAGFEWPSGKILWLLLLERAIMYFAVYLLTLARAAADPAFVQPVEDLKLLSNTLVSFTPDLTCWPGILMVFAGSVYLLWSARSRKAKPALA